MIVNGFLVIPTFLWQTPGSKSHESEETEVGDEEDSEKPGHGSLGAPVVGDNKERNDPESQVNDDREPYPPRCKLHQRISHMRLAVIDEL